MRPHTTAAAPIPTTTITRGGQRRTSLRASLIPISLRPPGTHSPSESIDRGSVLRARGVVNAPRTAVDADRVIGDLPLVHQRHDEEAVLLLKQPADEALEVRVAVLVVPERARLPCDPDLDLLVDLRAELLEQHAFRRTVRDVRRGGGVTRRVHEVRGRERHAAGRLVVVRHLRVGRRRRSPPKPAPPEPAPPCNQRTPEPPSPPR